MTDVHITITGWKGHDELTIIEAEGDYIIEEHRKVKESGDVDTMRHVIPKRNVHILYKILRERCDAGVQYGYTFVVRHLLQHYGFHEKEGMTMEQMLTAFNGGRNRARYYFKYYYYPCRVLEHFGAIQYFGKGGIMLKEK